MNRLKLYKEYDYYCEETCICVESDFLKINVSLNRDNKFSSELLNLPLGLYKVYALEDENTYKMFDLKEGYNEVKLSEDKYELTISLYKDEINKPDFSEIYEVVVSDSIASREYTLDYKNNYEITLMSNKEEKLTVKLLWDVEAIYEVDDRKVEYVYVEMNQNHKINIYLKEEDKKGTVLIQKYKEEENHLLYPKISNSYDVNIYGDSEDNINLNYENNFSYSKQLKEGYYRVNSEDNDSYYEIDGIKSEDGYFKIEEDKTTKINIIEQINRQNNGFEDTSNENEIKQVNIVI